MNSQTPPHPPQGKLSSQGRELMKRALNNNPSATPYSARRTQKNAFSGLQFSDDDEDEAEQVEIEEVEEDFAANKVTSLPSTHRSSPRRDPVSPRWTTVSSREKSKPPPKLDLASPAAIVSFANNHEEEGDDPSTWVNLTVDSKQKRSSHRSSHGSKANQFKALKQRLHNQARRDRQRQSSKPQEQEEQGSDNNEYEYAD